MSTNEDGGSSGEMTFAVWATKLRKDIKNVASELDSFRTVEKQSPRNSTAMNPDRGEMMANLTLAYRHLEDASGRLGKALQANDGGVSVYDRESTVGA